MRSVTDLNVPVWAPGLTNDQARRNERTQKCVFAIINGGYSDYKETCKSLKCDPLDLRI